MFSGIVEEVGEILSKKAYTNGYSFKIRSSLDVLEGDSISVSGACLTVTKTDEGSFWVDLSDETIRLSNLKNERIVNLERALSANGRINGHIVTGHLDGTAAITKIKNLHKFYEVTITFEGKLKRFLAPKGSVAIEGVSLTVNKIIGNSLLLMIIPYTFLHTNLKIKKINSKLNIEVDIMARYINNLSTVLQNKRFVL